MLPRVAFEYGHTSWAADTSRDRQLGIGNLRKSHVQLHRDRKTALLGRNQAHPAVDRDITDLGPFALADDAQSTFETSRVAHGEQLLRVSAVALAAHLLRRTQLHLQGSVTAYGRDRRPGLPSPSPTPCKGRAPYSAPPPAPAGRHV